MMNSVFFNDILILSFLWKNFWTSSLIEKWEDVFLIERWISYKSIILLIQLYLLISKMWISEIIFPIQMEFQNFETLILKVLFSSTWILEGILKKIVDFL